MILSTWKVRGLNNPSSIVEVRKYLGHNKFNFVDLLETKVKSNNKERDRRKLGGNGDGKIIIMLLIEEEFGWLGILLMLLFSSQTLKSNLFMVFLLKTDRGHNATHCCQWVAYCRNKEKSMD